MKKNTTCVHAGHGVEPITGAVTQPIFATSTYAYKKFGEHRGWEYSRTGNPTRVALEKAIAALEGGVDGIAFASGLAAIGAITDMFSPGDHIVAADNLYGGTYRLFKTITEARHGLRVDFVDSADPAAFAAAIGEDTKMVFVESPTNPLMQIVDIEAVGAHAKAVGALFVVDNTFLSPILQQPLALGADLVVHSTTKYLNGHSDGVGGVLVASTPELAETLHTIQNNAGAIMGPFDAYLVLRGIKTLGVRMARHEENGRALAQWLAERDDLEGVHFPGLPSHPQHELAAKQQGGFGGMISIELGSLERAGRFAEALKLFTLAESLGGVESLVCHPATMTHAAVPAAMRAEIGIGDDMVRLSVGIEDAEDLIADIEQALAAAGA